MTGFFFRLFFMLLLLGTATEAGALSGNINKSPHKVHRAKRDITLHQALRGALKNNHSLQRLDLNIVSSKLSVKAQESEFAIKVMPTSSVGYQDSGGEQWRLGVSLKKRSKLGITTSVTPQIQRIGETYRSSVDVSLNLPLLQGFGREYNLDGMYSSLYELENARRTLYEQQVNIVLRTVTAVYEIIKNQQQARLLSGQLKRLENHLAVTESKEKTGLATAMDVYRAELRLKDIQNERTVLQEQYENHTDQLKELMGVPMQGHLTVTAPVDYKPVGIDPEQAVIVALENRIEIEQAKQRVKELRRKMIIAKRDILPALDVNLDYERYADDTSFELTEDLFAVSLRSSTDFTRSDEKIAYARSKINQRQAEIDLKEEKQKIVKEVRSRINSMKKKEVLIADRMSQEKQIAGKLELFASKFKHGLADNFDLLEAQRQFQQVKTALLVDTVNYFVGTYQLRAALGTLVEARKR